MRPAPGWRMAIMVCLWACLVAVLSPPARAAERASPADVVVRDEVATTADWCATALEVSIDRLVEGGCDWQRMDRPSLMKRWDARAFWIRMDLRNDAPQPVEQWLEVGHPQMSTMTLYARGAQGWDLQRVGASVPLDARGAVEKTYGVLPVQVPARSTRTVWVRVVSDTVIVLRAQAWDPDAFKERLLQRFFWGSLGVGGFSLTAIFSLLMLFLTREAAYGFFAMGLTGQLFTISWVSGILQRFFWPGGWSSPTAIRDVGAMVALYGMYRFLLAFLPQVRRYPAWLACFRVTVYVSLVFMLASLLDLGQWDAVWFASVGATGIVATAICARAWRRGDRAAGLMMLAFGIFTISGLLRVLVLWGVLAFIPELSQLPFLAVFLVAPIMLLGLVDRTRQLQDELSRVQAESAAQLRFLASMSHELRSPLDNVLGNAQLLARQARSAPQIASINSIFDSGRQLLRIIDHILDYARGAAGVLRLQPAPLQMADFLRGIVRMARLLAAQRNNRFELRLGSDPQALRSLTVLADAERLRQVLGNLLGNAARHTSDGTITLHVDATTLPAEQVRLDLRVDDTGEGISLDEQDRIFKPFERAESRAPYHGKGAGLGLAIARQLIELMGGRVTVRSAPGEGASFGVSVLVPVLPAQVSPAAERLDAFDAAGYLGPRRTVLVVDDEGVSRTLLAQLLDDLGFEVLEASNGRAAVALLGGVARLDLVLTDQYMPDGDGWMVLDAVRAQRPEVPVVLVSAAPASPPPTWNPNQRFAAQFLRPLDHAQLLARIGDLLDLEWSASPVANELPVASQLSPAGAAAAPAAPAAKGQPQAAELQRLVQLVELGQVTAIRDWALRLRASQPAHAAFADDVLEAVGRLDLEALLHMAGGASASAHDAT